ncbi:MAG: class I SAM-dependent RNA methyltransferase [Myxococcaceae bacterium]
MRSEKLALYATASRGTEPFLAGELKTLGAYHVKQGRGGVSFVATLEEALRVCLWSRIAMRILYPLGESTVEGAQGLYDAVEKIPWEDHLTPKTTFAVDAALRDSEHRHSGFVALKTKDAIVDRMRRVRGARPNVDTREPDVRVVVHLSGKKLSLSLDLCGESLHRRGYRVAPVVASLKETLAATILLAAGFTGEEPLIDPMCGAGTFLLEGALIACRRAPALHRRLAVERWPGMGRDAQRVLAALKEEAKAQERHAPHPIWGLDKKEESIIAARKNVAMARVPADIHLVEGDALSPLPPGAPTDGLLVTNPPYGERLSSGQKGMKSFYFKLGDTLGQTGFRKFILAGNDSFESAFHHRPKQRIALWNGPLECELLEYSPAHGPRSK